MQRSLIVMEKAETISPVMQRREAFLGDINSRPDDEHALKIPASIPA